MGVERSKNVLAFMVKTEPRQLKSLGTDAFIASGSLMSLMYCDEGVRSRQKKLVAFFWSNDEFEFHGSNYYSLPLKNATTDLRSGKVTKIKLSALFRTLMKIRWQRSQSVRQCCYQWEKQIRLSRINFLQKGLTTTESLILA